MSLKAYVICPRNRRDLEIIDACTRDNDGIAYFDGALLLKEQNVFPPRTLVVLLTADRGDLKEFIVDEMGYRDFTGTIRRLDEFVTKPEDNGTFSIRHGEPVHFEPEPVSSSDFIAQLISTHFGTSTPGPQPPPGAE